MNLLNNQHIQLRALEPEDLAFLKAIENNQIYWQYSDTIQPFSDYILNEYIKVAGQSIVEAGQLRLLIADKTNKLKIGFVDLYDYNPRHARAGVAIIIHPDYQQRGYASQAINLICNYAFYELNLHQIYAGILSDNKASIKLFENAGFTCFGTKKDWVKINNQLKDELFYQKFHHEKQK
ncbi:MAG: GNAT family N-acetyltransferase [Psychroflexus sp.]|jgi:diamine N-acetyltransferase|nr:GNAT family N-acetyltransferase [Psychroflexus sp.]MDR9447726.1 GNAT family N-acetyltransferase [Psychroflexus sp.]